MTTTTDPNTDVNADGNQGNNDPGNQGNNAGTTDWQEAYKGLQRTLTATQAQAQLWKTERDESRSILEQAKGDLLLATGKAEDLAGKVSGFETQITDLTAKVQGTSAELERSKLIMSDYQDLAKFEAKGLLPKADNTDDLKTKLDDFRTALGESVTKKVDETLGGSSLPLEEESTDDELSDDVLREKMMAVAGVDNAEYTRLQRILDERSK